MDPALMRITNRALRQLYAARLYLFVLMSTYLSRLVAIFPPDGISKVACRRTEMVRGYGKRTDIC